MSESIHSIQQILFKEYGWPEKMSIQARYRAQQLRYNMDDYSSKGSRVTAIKKMHRNLGATEDSVHRGSSTLTCD